MAIYSSFLGQNDGYTKAQRAGLARSAGIKKKRKEKDIALEREGKAFQAREATKQRGHEELIEKRREHGLMAREGMQPQPESQYKLQELKGRQAKELSTQEAEQTAVQKSMEARRRLSEAEIKAGTPELRSFTTFGGEPGAFDVKTGKTQRLTLPPQDGSVGDRARMGLGQPAEQKEHTFEEFQGLGRDEQLSYMEYLKKNKPESFLSLAKQYKMSYASE